jgi:hypothetical protein
MFTDDRAAKTIFSPSTGRQVALVTYNIGEILAMVGASNGASHIFKVQFVNQGRFTKSTRKVSHGSLFGFIEVEELVFG